MQASATTDAMSRFATISTPRNQNNDDIIGARCRDTEPTDELTVGIGATTPSTVSASMAAPQWAQLMPETTHVQERKRISTPTAASASANTTDTTNEYVQDAYTLTPWQSASDLPERRVMVHRIIAVTTTNKLAPTLAQQQTAATLAKRIELSLYARASSLDEYRNVATLRRRLQSLVALSCHEATAARSLEQSQQQSPQSPKRRFPARTLGLGLVTPTLEFAIKRRRLAGLSVAPPVKCSGRLFAAVGDDCVRAIFAFLDTRDVLACRTVNAFAATFLPTCVVTLELSVMQLARCLASDDLGLRQFVNLERLTVVRCRATNVSNSKIAIPATSELTPLHAWDCTELDANDRNDGEVVVTQLAAALDAGAARRLRQLQLVSVFTNTSQRNALRALCDVLSRGACPQLEDLLLGGSSALDTGAFDIARLLQSDAVPMLTRLDLRRNYIGEAGLERLVAALAHGAGKRLRFLCLGGNIMTDQCVASLTALLAGCACPQLRFLGLEDNFLSPDGVQHILDAAVASGMAPQLHRAAPSVE